MQLHTWLSFLLASTLLCLSPGPTVLLVTGQAMAHGRRSVAPLVAGVLTGDAIAMGASFIGLGALLATSAALFSGLKWLGAVYLIYLGVKTWRRGPLEAGVNDINLAAGALYRRALLVTALNPKAIIFFMAFFPLFIDAKQPLPPQMLAQSLTFLGVSPASASLYAGLSGYLHTRLRSARMQRRINKTSGSLLVGAGLATATLQP